MAHRPPSAVAEGFQTKRLSAKWTARFFRYEKLCFPLGAGGHFHSHHAHGHGHWHHRESGSEFHGRYFMAEAGALSMAGFGFMR